MSANDCWVELYEHQNFERGKIRFEGPIEVRRLDDHRLDNGKSAGDEIDSLRTGPKAWLEVYEDENFEDTLKRFGPNSSISNLDDYGIGDNVDSFALFDHEPSWWAGAPGLHVKRVEPGDWRTLETTFNVPVAAGFVGPAGARVKVSHWLFSSGEEELDGKTLKVLTPRFGKIQILVKESCYVTYSFDPTGNPVNLPPIPVPLP